MNKRILHRMVATVMTLICFYTAPVPSTPPPPAATSSSLKNGTTRWIENSTSSDSQNFSLPSHEDVGLAGDTLVPPPSGSKPGVNSNTSRSNSTTNLPKPKNFGVVLSTTTRKTHDDDKGLDGPMVVAIAISVTFIALVIISIFLGLCLNRGRRSGRRSFGDHSNKSSSTIVTVVEHLNVTSTIDTTYQENNNLQVNHLKTTVLKA